MPQGGLPTLRHNEVWDLTAEMLKEVCSNVAIEPRLQPRMEKTSNSELPIVKMRQGVILMLRVSGVEDRSPSSMFRFFNLAPPLIETGTWQLYIDPTKE